MNDHENIAKSFNIRATHAMRTGLLKEHAVIRALLLLCFLLTLSFLPPAAFAAGGSADMAEQKDPAAFEAKHEAASEDTGNITISAEAEPETLVSSADSGESRNLLEGYLGKAVAEEIEKAEAPANGKKAMKARSRKNNLSGADLAIYNALASQIRDAAGGRRAGTEFKVPVRDVFGSKLRYTGKELGVGSVFVDRTGSGNYSISDEAMEAFRSRFQYNSSAIIDALLADFPYELYWYDKTAGCTNGMGTITAGGSFSNGAIVSDYIAFADEEPVITFIFYVSADYSSSGSSGTASLDTAKTARAASFAANSADIITKNRDKADEEKLDAYRQAVCDAADYDLTLVSGTRHYGDPWQLIYVFDGDPGTRVVCEGYSKAFQFLCDNTVFNNPSIDVWTVTGKMNGGTGEGSHMWNIVHMHDGKNYLADITNCDKGAVGADDKLFLRGCNAGGSVSGGYSYSCSAAGSRDIYYIYDAETRALFSDAELSMSASDYYRCPHIWDEGVRTSEPTCTGEGIITHHCTKCGDIRTTAIAPTGHSIDAFTEGRSCTCTEAGNLKYWTCSRCGRKFADANGRTGFKEGEWIIPAGHDWGKWKVTKEATCTERGSKFRVCRRDPSHTETAAISKKPHTAGSPVRKNKIKATYDSGGSYDEVVYCTVCGSEISRKHRTTAKLAVKDKAVVKINGSSYKVIKASARTAALTSAKNIRKFTVPAAIRIGGRSYKVVQVNAGAFTGSRIRTVIIGKNVKTLKKNAFASSRTSSVTLRTKLLKKAGVRGCLRKSRVKTVRVSVGKSLNKKFVSKYKKIFTKSNAGRKVSVKR